MVSFVSKVASLPVTITNAPSAPVAPIGKPISYIVRHWSHADKRWIESYETFTNRKAALASAAKQYAPSEKASVVALLSNGKRVFIKGTQR